MTTQSMGKIVDDTFLSDVVNADREITSENYQQHVQTCVALAKMVKQHPDVKTFAVNYFRKFAAPFYNVDEIRQSSSKRMKFSEPGRVCTDLDVVSACYDLLVEATEFFGKNWSWAKFMRKYCTHSDDHVRWICYQCIRIVLGLNEQQFSAVLKSRFTPETILRYTLEQDSHKNAIQFLEHPSEEKNFFVTEQTSNKIVCIGGVYLPVFDNGQTPKTNFVPVTSTNSNLHKLALGVAANKALCLRGPVGSGKTYLVEHLAQMTGRQLGRDFIKVQLSDQTDSKMLLGTYKCTDVPGEFVWYPGLLTQAVLEGHWLLLEDIDLASMDIASVLTALLETNTLTVPGYRDCLPVTPGFQLFFTQRLITTVSGYHTKQSNSLTLLNKHVLQVIVDPLKSSELETIVSTLHPKMKTIASRLVTVFVMFTHNLLNRKGRLVSARDLFKWCSRSIENYDVTNSNSALTILHNAVDIFCCSHPDEEERLRLIIDIGAHLGINSSMCEHICKTYQPHLDFTNEQLKTDRVILQKHVRPFDYQRNLTSTFCFTRPARCLIERVMCCVKTHEPVLLVGETGTGKTSSVQFVAHNVGMKLIVINMNQQSDSADLLGGYKPVDARFVVKPIKKLFDEVFRQYYKVSVNQEYLTTLNTAFEEQKWLKWIKGAKASCEAAVKRLNKTPEGSSKRPRNDTPEKKNKRADYLIKWFDLAKKLQKLETQLRQKNSLAFAFIEGSLVKAIENGHWVLLDEINLANAETLECLSGLLEGSEGSVSLMERGDKAPIKRHPDFTLFACMNPSTDVGKRDLPTGLRNRFTEFYVDELTSKNDLLLLVKTYLVAVTWPTEKLESIVQFYLEIKKEAERSLVDGVGHKPHFSLRTLCRALSIATKNPCGTFLRSLYEAFCLSFLTQLDSTSYKIVESLIAKYILGVAKNAKSILKQPIPKPIDQEYLEFEGYWVSVGNLKPEVPENYILTESVRANLRDLARVVSIGKTPVLLQGDTSVGKTSLIKYLAKSSGNKCVRINNHEHTDLQEYIGSYVADHYGKLVFREGLLVEAMRNGHWIILDELNLAPTDVLEALNRVLDDNRELFIPETQQVVKAHPKFMLFATQNPPGLYGGRKILSRAFRNRFVELHFNEIPPKELEFILHQRCQMAPTHAKKMIAVMTDLQTRRRGSAVFAGKQGFMTLRDLFRWGERCRLIANSEKKLYDWDLHYAEEGYLLLAGRVRRAAEREEIAETLQKHMKRNVNPHNLFTLNKNTSEVTRSILESFESSKAKYKNIVWTYNMRQLGVLLAKALQFKEPALLVGETGGGKTTICQVLSDINGQTFHAVNCHMHTESSDFIGSLRPVRDKSGEESSKRLFEWADGPLIQAMRDGDVFLADEISLADDSVLERLNSLLEPERSLLLAEKGDDKTPIVANEKFHFIGTMNPGGDHGKKELSLALRNRFTEIWCESCTDKNDLIDIIEQNVISGISFGNQEDGKSGIGKLIMQFIEWFKETPVGKKFTISIRDILTWVNFINLCSDKIDVGDAYLHGAYLTFLDSFGSGVTSTESQKNLETFRNVCVHFLRKQLHLFHIEVESFNFDVEISDVSFGIKPFYVNFGDKEHVNKNGFTYDSPTCKYNLLRLLRGLQLPKAILLEGSPGVGKTSMVTALAKSTRRNLLRINLSDQTDISDLFGADLPVEDGLGGQFAWRDGPFLRALKRGDWILLDELNLASQSVLEGLNACLDHRGEIFVPELGKTFQVKSGTRLFASQNPLKQGGSRRGLPQSFLNRFTQVYVDPLCDKDLLCILKTQFPTLPQEVIFKMVEFNAHVVEKLESHTFGHKGSPWEFNLRDLTRWCEALLDQDATRTPERLIQLIYEDRMRTSEDKLTMRQIFQEVFGCAPSGLAPAVFVAGSKVHIGDVCLEREINGVNGNILKQNSNSLVLRSQTSTLRSLAYCVKFGWMTILVGSSGSGKSSVVHTLANLVGKTVHTLPVTSAMDTTDLLGGFEQVDYTRHLEDVIRQTEIVLLETAQEYLVTDQKHDETVANLLSTWENFRSLERSEGSGRTMSEETGHFLDKLDELRKIWERLLSEDHPSSSKIYDRLAGIREQGEKIRRVVAKERNLNAGGRFEWVDSILIKCLREGSWLLVDNVNLCSPAVLDRLNALLEPQGVLTIGERGVGEDGEMVEVKPHKEFRLFLTMDPKNGEISRAMRNRGIEIFILKDSERGHTDLYDLKSLITNAGLQNNLHIDILLKMHNFISDFVLGEKPGVNNLLQASFLISQELSRGERPFDAFYNTLQDIYCRTYSGSELDASFSLDILKEQLNSTLLVSKDSFFHLDMTLQTAALSKCSSLEHIKQQGVLIGQPANVANLEEFLLYFWTLSNRTDLKLRLEYSRIVLFKDPQLLELSKVLLNCLEENMSISNCLLPFDEHWTPDFKQNSLSVANKLYILLNLAKLHIKVPKQIGKKGQELSLYVFLNGIRDKKVEARTDDPLENHMLDILDTFDEALKTYLKHTQLNITDEQTITILSLIRWRFIVSNLLAVNIHKTKLSEYRAILTNLRVHFKWFLKYSVKSLFNEVFDDVSPVKQILNSHLNIKESSSALKKLAKTFQKHGEVPPPLINEVQVQAFKKYLETSERFDIYDKTVNFEVLVKQLITNADITNNVFKSKLYMNYDFTEEPKNLTDLHELNCSKNVNITESERSRVVVFPLVDYFSRLDFFKYISKITENPTVFNNLLTVPVDLLACVSRYRNEQDARLLHELKLNLFEYFCKSACIKNEKFYQFGTEEEAMNTENVRLAQFSPILSVLIGKLLVVGVEDTKSVVKATRYGNFRMTKSQHRAISLMIFKNRHQISDKSYNYINCQQKYLLYAHSNFVNHLSNTLNINSISKELIDLETLCIRAVETILVDNISEEKTFVLVLKKYFAQIRKLNDESRTMNEILNTISSTHILLNYLKIAFNSKLPLIDPLMKIKLKRQYCSEEIHDLSLKVESYRLLNKVIGSSEDGVHSYVPVMNRTIDDLSGRLVEFGKYVAVRPDEFGYSRITKKISTHLSTIFTLQQIFEFYEQIEKNMKNLFDGSEAISVKDHEIFLQRCTHQLTDYESVYNLLKKYRFDYPDIIQPLLCNLAEFNYGIRLKIELYERLLLNHKTKIEPIADLVKFPYLDSNSLSYRKVVFDYSCDKFRKFVAKQLENIETHVSQKEQVNLIRTGLHELYNCVIIVSQNFKILDVELFESFNSLLRAFISAWKKQEEELELQKEEDAALYKIKTKIKTEEEETQEQFDELFPSYFDADFSDMQLQVLGDDKDVDKTPSLNYVGAITLEDVRFVSKLHQSLVRTYTKTEWLNPRKEVESCDFITPLLSKFKLFKLMLDKCAGKSLDYTVDSKIINTLSILSNVAQNFGISNHYENLSQYNFYKDPNVEEITASYHILEELRLKIVELLNEWPGHPGLRSIKTIIDRIYSFEITSPVSRYLTGFEILLTKCHEWEQNAHSGVSVSNHLANIIQQIITWRKLEMKMWKESLNQTYERMNEPLGKWWFYLHELMDQFVSTSTISVDDLISTLQKFITSSNLAEFSGRIQLLYAFHCHAAIITKSPASTKFSHILWNVYKYFEQFNNSVSEKIKTLRAPIERKLKEYVKIVKWKDVSYWSVKETVEKTHKVLHKHIREFEAVLNHPVTPCLTTKLQDVSKPSEKKKEWYSTTPNNYLAPAYKSSTLIEETDSILSKIDGYFVKSRQLCKKAVTASQYGSLIADLDDFIVEIIEQSDKLKNLEVNRGLPKEKQMSQARGILQLKKKALADLFKILTDMGVSYRTGIVHSKTKKNSEPYEISPVDLKASSEHLLNSFECDKNLLQAWEGCEIYFNQSLSRLESLESILINPSKDLGISNIDRCNGFSQHLTKYMVEQKSKVVESTRVLSCLKHYFEIISVYCTDNVNFIPREKYGSIKELLQNVLITAEQFKVVIQSYPEDISIGDDLNIILPVLREETFSGIKDIRWKNDESWLACKDCLDQLIHTTQKVILSITKHSTAFPTSDYKFPTSPWIPIVNIEKTVENLKFIASKCEELTFFFGKTNSSNSLDWLKLEVQKLIDLFINSTQNVENNSSVDNLFKKHTEKLLEKVLIVIQNVYKKYNKSEPTITPQDSTENEENTACLKEGHFRKLIIDNLTEDFSLLNMNGILKSVEKLVRQFYTIRQDSNVLGYVLPCLQQLILLYEYFITQQVSTYRVTCKFNSVLTSIFIELATNGFCIPPDLEEELKGEGGTFSGEDGTGLGDGRGEKDISDKIESEDQLEDAQPADREKEDKEDPDCKEEDKAIEMTEDFDSKLQDVEKGEDDDEQDDENDDKDAEEQMGETDKGVDQLDKEVWGSDNEDDNEEDEAEKQEESGSKGEKDGKSELGAKEKESEDKEFDSNDGDKSKEEKKPEINELMDSEIDDEQVDPYHLNPPEYPEPEDFDLPEDVDTNEGENDDQEKQEEANPFEIDTMKEQMSKNEEESEKVEENKEDNPASEDHNDSEEDSQSDIMETQTAENEESCNPEENETTPPNLEDKSKEQDQPDEDPSQNNEEEKSGLDRTENKTEDNVEAMDVDDNEASDNVQANPSQNQQSQHSSETVPQEDNTDQKGAGQSNVEESQTGHDGKANAQQNQSSNLERSEEKISRRRPGESDSKRTLGDANERVHKRLKAMDVQQNEEEKEEAAEGDEAESAQEAEAYRHVKEAHKSNDQMLDVATKEQIEQQKKDNPNLEHKDGVEDEGEKADNVPMDIEEKEEEEEKIETLKQKAEKVESEKKKNSQKGQHPEGEILEQIDEMDVEGEVIQTLGASRSGDTTHHTLYANLESVPIQQLTVQEVMTMRQAIENQLSTWNEPPMTAEAEQTWENISSLTSSLSQTLCEQLRLVLEPTQASRLRGDYRTGRRINMRKVIPYIASQFRKDKIWLRRTKPSKRDYQIALAIDNSSSMSDNHSKQLALESLALISKALTLLESGQLAVISFGQDIRLIHKLTDTFTDRSGAKVLQEFGFDEKKTNVGELVEFSTAMLSSAHSSTSSDALIAKLLIMISDGRGIFSEGELKVRRAVRRAQLENVFTVFVIIDNPNNKDSILDIRKPIFEKGQLKSIDSYMDHFPFPFYIILKDINTLPNVLSDALRQWFEIVTSE